VLFSQFLDKIKQVTNITTSDVLQFTKDNYIEHLKKSREEFDVSDFNYAVSYSIILLFLRQKRNLEELTKYCYTL